MIYIKKHRTFYFFEKDKQQIWKMSLSDLEPLIWMNFVKKDPFWERKLIKALNGKALANFGPNSEVTLFEIKDDGSGGRVVTSNILNKNERFESSEISGDSLIGYDRSNNELVSCKIKDDLTVMIIGKFNLSSGIHKFSDLHSCFSLVFCPLGKYVLIYSHNHKGGKNTQQKMISLNGSEIRECAFLDLSSQNFDDIAESLTYFKTMGDEMIFKCVVCPLDIPSTVMTTVYNKRTKELKELKNHRKVVQDQYFFKLAKYKNALYSIGYKKSKLLEIR